MLKKIKKNKLRKLISILMILVISAISVNSVTALESKMLADNDVQIKKIDFKRTDFIKGMDISSVISLENSGVSFYDENGREEDIFKILSENGVNYIRVRVWNNPYTSARNGYGGGNNNVAAAATIGSRAAKYGMKLLVDFHYSDFWADPGKQKAPKAWANLSVAQKEVKVRQFTESALREISDAGAKIGMVQIGNETTNGIAGVYNRSDMAKIFNAGASAVRAFDSSVLIAVHFTNPEKTEYIKSLADFLNDYKVDYDVFATSYYPYWHGSLSNLTEVLNYAAVTYGKYTMVAETSYAYTLKDSDGHPNTVSQGSNNTGSNLLWDFNVQGQAEEVRAVMSAVNNVENGLGLGVFYWEGAWITVGDTTALTGSALAKRVEANKALWEAYGSGWAASFAGEFDTDDAGKWYRGSAVDNQAFFNPSGKALPSLKVFQYVGGNPSFLLGDVTVDNKINIEDVTAIQKYIAELEKLDNFQKLAANVNGDEKIDIDDVTVIQKYIAEIITSF